MSLSGGPLDYLVAFVGGFLMSLTPCVYPLLPISVSYIGANSLGSKSRSFILSLIYVTGMAITYAGLGIIASLTGRIFGVISSSPFTYIFFAAVIIIFGLSMLEVINIPLPVISMKPQLKKPNLFSVLLLGLTSGLVISPCVSPVLGSILAYLAIQKKILYGASLLFVFAFGMGLIFIAAGVFSGLIFSLPKSGKWMVYIKKGCGSVLVALGIYFAVVGFARLNPAFAADTQLAPDIKLNYLKQDASTLSGFRGKKSVLLLFWTTWCPFCREQLVQANDQYPQLSKQGLEILAVNVGEPSERVEKFAGLRGLSLPFIIDLDSSAAMSFDVIGVPTYVLIDKEGYVVLKDNYFPKKGIQEIFDKQR